MQFRQLRLAVAADPGEGLVRVDDTLILQKNEPLAWCAPGLKQALVQTYSPAELLFGAPGTMARLRLMIRLVARV
jgi:hypothetical protein